MLLKASTDYGLRAILYLASKGGTCSSRDIAKEMDVPRDYLIQIAQQLRNAGIIEARPGKNGGYRLAKDPSEITLLEVTEALREDARSEREIDDTTAAVSRMRQAFDLVLESYDVYLDSITMKTILQCSQSANDSREILGQKLSDEGERLANGSRRILAEDRNIAEAARRSKANQSLMQQKVAV